MNKRTIFLLLAFATLITVGAHLLFKPIKDTAPTANIQDVKELESSFNQLNNAHHAELASLNEKNEQLLTQVQFSKVQIVNAGKQVKKLTSEVQRLSNRSLSQVDTNTYITTCDSLQHQINVYLLANSYKDSLVNRQVQQYELLLDNKDSTISCYETDYSVLNQTTNNLLRLNQQLANDNQHYQKALVRNKRKAKVLSGTALLLAGIATATQLRSAN